MDTEHPVAFSALSAAARGLWAKSGEPTGHGLLAHLLDVAAVVERLLAIEPPSTRQWAATAFGLDSAACPRWIAALAGLHDFGKGIPGFQAKWPEGMQADQAHGLAFSALTQRVDRHDLATAALLGPVLHRLAVASPGWLRQAVLAVSAHHGYHFQPTEVQNGTPPAEAPAWAAARGEVFGAFWHLLAPQGRPSAERLPWPPSTGWPGSPALPTGLPPTPSGSAWASAASMTSAPTTPMPVSAPVPPLHGSAGSRTAALSPKSWIPMPPCAASSAAMISTRAPCSGPVTACCTG